MPHHDEFHDLLEHSDYTGERPIRSEDLARHEGLECTRILSERRHAQEVAEHPFELAEAVSFLLGPYTLGAFRALQCAVSIIDVVTVIRNVVVGV